MQKKLSQLSQIISHDHKQLICKIGLSFQAHIGPTLCSGVIEAKIVHFGFEPIQT